MAAAIAGCGGGSDREGASDREVFVGEASKACSDMKRELEELPDLTPLAEGAVKLYERELERLQAIKPPAEVRDRYREMLRYKEAALNDWREFVRHAEVDDFKGGEPASERNVRNLVRASRIGKELHLDGCDRALS